jgi:hypothetical protein
MQFSQPHGHFPADIPPGNLFFAIPAAFAEKTITCDSD